MARVTVQGQHAKIAAEQGQIEMTAKAFGGRLLGSGTELMSMTRDLEFVFETRRRASEFSVAVRSHKSVEEVF